MDLEGFKIKRIREITAIDQEKFGKIFTFIDFANVNRWFSDDIRDGENNILPEDKELGIDLNKLLDFNRCFSVQSGFYYGHDPKNKGSMKFLGKSKYVFGEKFVFSKPLQQVKHYLKDIEKAANTRSVAYDLYGDYIYLPKCNFDVEICVDAIRLMAKYDTFCLWSSDADFVSLIKHLRNNGKKAILIKGGFVQHSLINNSDLVINAQDIKNYITYIKQKSSLLG
ncbi:MAG: NYN domain-containing protein [Patescibacteria group bacterium]